jgi:hypothetical protein
MAPEFILGLTKLMVLLTLGYAIFIGGKNDHT